MRVRECLLLVCAWCTWARGADLVIRNVTIVDVQTGAEHQRSSVWIHGGQIAAAGAQVRGPAAATVIDGAGKFLIPGLWDMHVHLWYRENQFPLYLANGVTGVRDMGSDLNWVNRWRNEVKAGRLLGPRIQTCGPAVDGVASDDAKLPVLVVQQPNDGRTTFDRLDNMDVDFVKVLSMVPRDAYFALIERARKWYVPVAGHVPESVSLSEAIDARQKSVEHMTGVLMACSRREDNLRNRKLLAIEKQDDRAYSEVDAEVLRTFDPQKAADLFERMARFDTREVPTLVMLRRSMYLDAAQLAADPHLREISPAIRRDWTDPRADRKKLSDETLQRLQTKYAKLCELVLQMKRAGVMLMAGTDTGDPYSFPGYELHRELQLLVEAGLTPLEALRSATLEPARFFNADDTTGLLEKGRPADLVLLDADPLKDIRNTQKIDAVILRGRYLSKAHLHTLVREARD